MKSLFFILATSLLFFACTNDPKENPMNGENDPASNETIPAATPSGTSTSTTGTNVPHSATETTPSANPAPEEDAKSDLLLPITDDDGIMETISVFDSTTQRVLKVKRPTHALSSAIGPNPISKIDPVKPVIKKPAPTTPQESRVTRILTNNYWVVWGLLRINDKTANRFNQGTWFKFNDDGTYDYGFMEKKVGSGGWRFDGKKAYIILDSELYGDDRQWRITINNSETEMVWVGVPEIYTTNVQLKLQNFLFIPKNRKEIGLPE